MKVLFDYSQDEANGIKTFYFKPDRPLRYTAGQFIELTIKHDSPDNRGQKRWFSLSSSPSEELLSITTKFATDGGSTLKQALLRLTTGDEVQMSEAMGDFVLPKDKDTEIIFVAGGIGITPVRSMVQWSHDASESRNITVIYGVNQIEDIAFRKVFESADITPHLIVSKPSPEWHSETGHITAEKILSTISNPDKSFVYVTGPEPMVESLFKSLKDLGFNKRSIVTDYFPGYTEI